MIFFTSICTCSFGQKYQVEHYTEVDGLSNSNVFDIEQDSMGQMWFATRNGISMYDANEWHTYGPMDGLNNRGYAGIVIDRFGKIWTIPKAGKILLSKFEDGKWLSQIQANESPVFSSINFLEVLYDMEGNMYAIIAPNSDGIWVYKHGRLEHIDLSENIPMDRVSGLQKIGDSVLIASHSGLHLFHNYQLYKNIEQEYGIDSDIYGIAFQQLDKGKNRIWLAGKTWIGYISDNRFTLLADHFNFVSDKQSYYVKLQADKQGVYTYNPFSIYYHNIAKGTTEELGLHSGLISEGATDILIDREKNLWIAGHRGVNKLSSKLFAKYNELNGLYDNEVTSIEKLDEELILGHHGAISFFDGKRFDHLELHHPENGHLLEKWVQDICIDADGIIWLAASKLGLARLERNKTTRWLYTPDESDLYVSSVVEGPQGVKYFITTLNLFMIDRNGEVIRIGTPKPGIYMRKIFLGDDKSLLIGSLKNGLLKYKEGQWSVIKTSDSLSSNNVYSYLADSQGNEWVGMLDGLYQKNDDSLVKVKNKKIQINRSIYLIAEDSEQNLWFGTDNGLFKWDGQAQTHYSTLDGLAGQELNRDAFEEDNQGRLYFGTNNGLSVYEGKYASKKDIPPPLVALDFVEAGSDTFKLKEPLKLKYDQSTLFFHYKAVSFINEDDIAIKCKLEGIDKEWSKEFHTYDNVVRYNNVPPGNYSFCIKARNAVGIWSEAVCSPQIQISKVFYKRWDFIVVLILLILASVYYIFRYIITKRYTYSLKRQVASRTKELKNNEQKLKQLNSTKDRFFSIIAHDLRSPFNAIMGLSEYLMENDNSISSEERKSIISNLYQSSRSSFELLENLLTWARSQEGKLSFFPDRINITDIINDNIDLMKSSSERKKIKLLSTVTEDLFVHADYNMINTVMRNLISNAIKFTADSGIVNISSKVQDTELMVCVRDTGIGLPEEMINELFVLNGSTEREGTTGEKGTGLGLVLCGEFIRRNKGHIWAENNKGKGAKFCFTLPRA
ncbi:MAG: two-component regulator propeller domain-containing protein [Bacteroidota bacterium]|nr:two-component regulator propeller domain-containing protein [Bacteroidota bacterium]